MADFNLGTARGKIEIDASDVDKLSRVSNKVHDELRGQTTKTSTALGKMGGGLKTLGSVGLLAFGGLATGAALFAKSAVGAYTESAKVGAQSTAVLKSTGEAAGITAKQVGALATTIRDYSGIDDEAVQSGENMLLTFRNIRNETGKGNDIFNQATTTLADMSVALGTDMSSSAIQLGKALNDPIKGVTALSRMGVTFNEEQKKQIATMMKAGDIAGAQKVILKELADEFGGSAKAMGKANPAGIIQSQMGDLQETIGGALMPIITQLLKAIGPTLAQITPIIAEFIGQLATALGPVLVAMGPLLGILAGALGKILVALTPLIPPLIQLILALAPLITLVAEIASGLLGLLVPALSFLIGVIAKVVAVIVGFLVHWRTVWTQVKAIGLAIWNAIRAAISAFATGIKTIVMTQFNLMKSGVLVIWNGMKTAAGTIFNVLKTAILTPINAIKTAWNAIWLGIKSFTESIWNGIVGGIKFAVNVIIRILNGLIHAWNIVPFHDDAPYIPLLARGTKNWMGGLAIVGERGPELLNLPRGSDVLGANATRNLLSSANRLGSVASTLRGGAGGTQQSWNVVINNPTPEKSGDSLLRTMRKIAFMGAGG